MPTVDKLLVALESNAVQEKIDSLILTPVLNLALVGFSTGIGTKVGDTLADLKCAFGRKLQHLKAEFNGDIASCELAVMREIPREGTTRSKEKLDQGRATTADTVKEEASSKILMNLKRKRRRKQAKEKNIYQKTQLLGLRSSSELSKSVLPTPVSSNDACEEVFLRQRVANLETSVASYEKIWVPAFQSELEQGWPEWSSDEAWGNFAV